jgi:uncharacterized cysteine cluster protein YcgN (CxxCxxCC family)
MTTTSPAASLVVETDPVAEYRARYPGTWRAWRTGALYLLYLYVVAPFIVIWKPWDLRQRFAALRLKIHNVTETFFYPERTAQNLAMRRGDCNRCGVCCKLLNRCPHLIEDKDGPRCGIYKTRYDQCATFPIDPRTLALVNAMGATCSYAFATETETAPRLVDLLTPPSAALK